MTPFSAARGPRSTDTPLALNLTPAEWHASLGSQMEELFVQVWSCESAASVVARADDRLALALRLLPNPDRERRR